MANGGARKGAGRKSKADEDKVRNLAVQSIVSTYGSEEEGFAALLQSGEASLVKFVYEHAFGKPKEKLDITSKGESITWQEIKQYDSNKETD